MEKRNEWREKMIRTFLAPANKNSKRYFESEFVSKSIVMGMQLLKRFGLFYCPKNLQSGNFIFKSPEIFSSDYIFNSKQLSIMAEVKNGKAETATKKKEQSFRDLKGHIKRLKKVKETVNEISALKRTDVGKIIDGEIEKAVGLARKIQEKELKEMLG